MFKPILLLLKGTTYLLSRSKTTTDESRVDKSPSAKSHPSVKVHCERQRSLSPWRCRNLVLLSTCQIDDVSLDRLARLSRSIKRDLNGTSTSFGDPPSFAPHRPQSHDPCPFCDAFCISKEPKQRVRYLFGLVSSRIYVVSRFLRFPLPPSNGVHSPISMSARPCSGALPIR